MKQIGQFLLKKSINRPSIIDEKSIFFVFETVIKEEYGKQGVGNIKPHMYRDHKLFVKTFSSNWANELWLNKKHILKRVNDEIGSEEVHDLATT